jgi:hypothetical protein
LMLSQGATRRKKVSSTTIIAAKVARRFHGFDKE